MLNPSTPSPSPRIARWELAALIVVLLGALLLRTWELHRPVLWCDEAESTINALTILQHGVPTDSYQGNPIYENMLHLPWPEHPEYEFRDSSYSSKGLAVYHAWLPLYSIAGALKVAGIEPDDAPQALVPQYGEQQIDVRTFVPRIPSVIYGMIFLVVIFCFGRDVFGRDVGWAALLAAAVAQPMVHIARQARYYSLTVLLSTACCYMAWRMYKHGTWRDYLIGALVFSALFHSHVLTFAIACAATSALAIPMLKRPGGFAKCGVFAAILALAVMPWAVLTGFLQTAMDVPKAIEFLTVSDLLGWPLEHWPITTLVVVGVVLMVGTHALRHRLPDRMTKPFSDMRLASGFVVLWVVLGYWGFVLLIPAASLSFQRAYLAGIGPGIVFGAVIFCALGRMAGRNASIAMAVVTFCLFIWGNVRSDYSWTRDRHQRVNLLAMLDEIDRMRLPPDARLYATPNNHLILTYYSGLPVQSIAPVRREFLQSYPGEIVLLQCFPQLVPLQPTDVKTFASRHGATLSDEQALDWADYLSKLGLGRYVGNDVGEVAIPQRPLPPWAGEAMAYQQSYTRWRLAGPDNPIGENAAVFKGLDHPDYSYWWKNFFYRFVDPHLRRGDSVNYRRRMSNATVTILPSMWMIYRSPGPLADAVDHITADTSN